MVDTKSDPEVYGKKNLKPLIMVSFILSLAAGIGAFYGTQKFFAPQSESEGESNRLNQKYDVEGYVYIPLDTIIISLGEGSEKSHLRLRMQLEVPKAQKQQVEQLKPRVIDVLNTFLRALKLEELERPTALTLLRTKMLRRIKIVLGEEVVNDLLISEFVLN